MNISIKKEVFSKFNPEFKIAFISAKGIDNQTKLKESQHLLAEAEQFIRLTFNQETTYNHYLIQPWTAAKLEFGKKAKHYHTSVEGLIKRIINGGSVVTKDIITNISKYVALKHIIPYGADDLKKIDTQLIFRIAKGTEKKGLLRKLAKGALLYKDKKDILGTKLDSWKNSKTELTPKTKNALVHLEALPPITAKKLKEIADETAGLIQNFCGGKVKVIILNKKKPSAKV